MIQSTQIKTHQTLLQSMLAKTPWYHNQMEEHDESNSLSMLSKKI